MFLVGNFVALPAFKERFGVQLDGKWVIETKWQSALFQAGQCGAFVGVFAAGPVTNKLGYKWTTFCALVAMICTIFISFFVSPVLSVSAGRRLICQATSLSVLTVGQFFEGIPWGFFIANSPAYASEIVPLALRGFATSTIQMCWSIGGIVVGAVTCRSHNLIGGLANN
jgi:SP family general alpha glucoside:H+ symporter-like MFS transporter